MWHRYQGRYVLQATTCHSLGEVLRVSNALDHARRAHPMESAPPAYPDAPRGMRLLAPCALLAARLAVTAQHSRTRLVSHASKDSISTKEHAWRAAAISTCSAVFARRVRPQAPWPLASGALTPRLAYTATLAQHSATKPSPRATPQFRLRSASKTQLSPYISAA